MYTGTEGTDRTEPSRRKAKYVRGCKDGVLEWQHHYSTEKRTFSSSCWLTLGFDFDRHRAVRPGSPAPEVQWLKDGTPLLPAAQPRVMTSHEPGRVTLTIDDITETDAGRYTCTMSNTAGTATSTADLVVKSKRLQEASDSW